MYLRRNRRVKDHWQRAWLPGPGEKVYRERMEQWVAGESGKVLYRVQNHPITRRLIIGGHNKCLLEKNCLLVGKSK